MCEVFGSKYLKLMNLAMSFDIWIGNGSCPPLKNSKALTYSQDKAMQSETSGTTISDIRNACIYYA